MASKIFFGSLLLMFIIASFHLFMQTYRMMRAYGWLLGPDGTPLSYIQLLGWDSSVPLVLMAIMIWVGDALVIYRCYIIWGNNYYVIVIPALLALTGMAGQIALFVWWKAQFTTYAGIEPLVNMTYPINFTQNILTTGLIAFKIIKQHRLSRQSGLQVTSRVSLLHIARIMVESAALYTLELLLCIILNLADHPLQFVIQSALVPSIGITFVLIAIRVHMARDSSQSPTVSSSVIPPWLSDNDPAFIHPTAALHGESGSSGSDNSHSLQILGPRKIHGNGIYVHQETSMTDTKPVSVV